MRRGEFATIPTLCKDIFTTRRIRILLMRNTCNCGAPINWFSTKNGVWIPTDAGKSKRHICSARVQSERDEVKNPHIPKASKLKQRAEEKQASYL